MTINPEIIAELAKAQGRHTSAWLEVIEWARKYAMMKTHGSYIDDKGVMMHMIGHDREAHESYYTKSLLRAIMIAYAEDALFGADVATHVSK